MSGFAPDFASAQVRVSPNFGQRADNQKPSIIILHYTGMPSGQAAEDWLCNTDSQVSSHYLVHLNGTVVQMVRESDRAWHAGKSSWRGITDINSASIGIEIVNPGHEFGYANFPRVQMASVIALCADIVRRQDMELHLILGHSDVAPGRKVDPGERFSWRMLAKAGLGHFVDPSPIRSDEGLAFGAEGEAVQSLQTALSLYGYGIDISGEYDERTRTVVSAFQQHFRQRRVDGIADRSTVRTLMRLIAALPKGALTS